MGTDSRGKFRIFISWSKSPSREVAQVVMDFLNTVLDGVHVWTSDSGILPGTRPMVSIHENLYEADAGILLITRENQDSPWINYEAGVLAQKVGDRENLVVPLLIDSQRSTDITGPLADLHNATFTESEILKVVKALATASGSNESKVVTRFKLAWPGTKAKYEAIMTNHSIAAKREDSAERSILTRATFLG